MRTVIGVCESANDVAASVKAAAKPSVGSVRIENTPSFMRKPIGLVGPGTLILPAPVLQSVFVGCRFPQRASVLKRAPFSYSAPMFIGHHGVAFAAKAAAPRASLGLFFLATMWLDLVWPVLLLANIEIVRIVPGLMRMSPFDFVSYPYSHSLLFAVIWALVFNLVYGLVTRDWQAGALAGLV